jgi:hypothetical protein
LSASELFYSLQKFFDFAVLAYSDTHPIAVASLLILLANALLPFQRGSPLIVAASMEVFKVCIFQTLAL